MIKGYDSNLEEIEANREDCYDQIVARAVKALNIPQRGRTFSLFKPTSAHIPNTDLPVKSTKRKWTLRNYLLMIKKSPSQVKFGVGYSECEQSETVCILLLITYTQVCPYKESGRPRAAQILHMYVTFSVLTMWAQMSTNHHIILIF